MAARYSLICCHMGVRQENKFLQGTAQELVPVGLAGSEQDQGQQDMEKGKSQEAEENQKQSYEGGEMQREGAS